MELYSESYHLNETYLGDNTTQIDESDELFGFTYLHVFLRKQVENLFSKILVKYFKRNKNTLRDNG